MRDRIIVALDLPDAERALAMARTLRGRVGWVKVGMTLYYAEGPQIVGDLRAMGFKVFVDLKLHDIPHQIEGACRTLTRAGRRHVHRARLGRARDARGSCGGATTAAAEKFKAPRPSIIAVTVLTSLDDAALAEIGVSNSSAEQVAALRDARARRGLPTAWSARPGGRSDARRSSAPTRLW